MRFINCPDWICKANGVPYDYVYGLTVFFMAIPYLILLLWLYKKWLIKSSRKRKYFFILTAPLGYVVYNYILLFALLDSKHAILSFIGMISYGPIMTLILVVPFLLLGIITLLVRNYK